MEEGTIAGQTYEGKLFEDMILLKWSSEEGGRSDGGGELRRLNQRSGPGYGGVPGLWRGENHGAFTTLQVGGNDEMAEDWK
jgi:hypothetical protein